MRNSRMEQKQGLFSIVQKGARSRNSMHDAYYRDSVL